MAVNKTVLSVCCALALAVSGCSRQQGDWQKTREANTTDSYEQFLKKYPSGEFTAQAQARVKELYEERDWQKARDADTADAYQGFVKQYPEGKWTEEARIRVENFTLAQAPGPAAAPVSGAGAVSATGAETAPKARAEPVTKAPQKKDESPKSGSRKSGSGTYGVQLGAYRSGAGAAKARWVHLQKEYSALLAGLNSTVAPKGTASGTIYRLQASGLTEKRARAICAALKAKSQACVVVPPVHG